MKNESEAVDFEVISPGGKKASTPQPNDAFFALYSRLMDDFFVIPGTNIRFGLDPIIGLVPGLGDGSGALVSALLIVRGARAGLPRIVLARMALNVLINTMGGAIPVVGDVFSVWFKSNRLNYALYEKHAGQSSIGVKVDWLFVIGLILGLLAVVGAVLFLSVTLLAAIWQLAWKS